MNSTAATPPPAKAWIVTGPTSGIGRRTALELARHGTVVLVGRDPGKLAEPFAFTEALVPHLRDGANIVFTCSATEDPERKPAVAAGFRGGRYISAEASARGEWQPGFDAYATSKQGNLATVLVFARETPRLRFNAVEPGFNPGTGLGRDVNVALRLLGRYVLAPLAPFVKYWSTPKHAARVITAVLTGESDATGVYYDENGKPMLGSAQVRDSAFADRYVAETRALLATVPSAA